MKPEYLHFPNGQKFRVEANWNSFETFCDLTGRTDLAALDQMKDIRMNEAPLLMWACIREGEEADGNKFLLSVKEMKRRINPILMGKFFEIYSRQTYAQLPEEYQTKKKGLTNLFKKKSPSE